MDCSFDENKSYVEQGNEWDNLTIDTVSVTPPNSQDTDSVYTLSADNLSTVSTLLWFVCDLAKLP